MPPRSALFGGQASAVEELRKKTMGSRQREDPLRTALQGARAIDVAESLQAHRDRLALEIANLIDQIQHAQDNDIPSLNDIINDKLGQRRAIDLDLRQMTKGAIDFVDPLDTGEYRFFGRVKAQEAKHPASHRAGIADMIPKSSLEENTTIELIEKVFKDQEAKHASRKRTRFDDLSSDSDE